MAQNSIIIYGEVISNPVFSHKAGDMDFYKFEMVVRRPDETEQDIVTIMIPSSYLEDPMYYFEIGDMLKVHGELGSYVNIKTKEYNKYIYVHHIAINKNVYRGSRETEVRLEAIISKLRFEKNHAEANLTVRKGDKITLSIWCSLDYIPEEIIENLKIGDKVFAVGQYITKQYKSVDETGTKTELSQEILAADIFC